MLNKADSLLGAGVCGGDGGGVSWVAASGEAGVGGLGRPSPTPAGRWDAEMLPYLNMTAAASCCNAARLSSSSTSSMSAMLSSLERRADGPAMAVTGVADVVVPAFPLLRDNGHRGVLLGGGVVVTTDGAVGRVTGGTGAEVWMVSVVVRGGGDAGGVVDSRSSPPLALWPLPIGVAVADRDGGDRSRLRELEEETWRSPPARGGGESSDGSRPSNELCCEVDGEALCEERSNEPVSCVVSVLVELVQNVSRSKDN